MRICIIAPPWVPVPPPRYGGTEAVVDSLARGLVGCGCDVLLVTTGDATCPVERSWLFEAAVGTNAGVAAELAHVVHAYQVAESWGAQVVHDHTLAGPFLGRARTSIPIVTTNHGPFDAHDLEPIYRALAPDVAVVAISESQAAAADGIRIAGVIPHGVELDRYPVGAGGAGAACLCRMHPDKGIDAACRIARAAGIPLRIAAKMHEPLELEWFEHAVRPLLGGDVEYLGELGFDEKLELLGSSSCLLNPIRWQEPFGLNMVEALACGTPVVSRACGAAREIVDDGRTGFLRGTDDELADALAWLPALDRADCRAAVEQRWSAERMVRDHIELYVRAVTGARTAA
jgi:glycosyltransferase involved in cell wall biosynthesis